MDFLDRFNRHKAALGKVILSLALLVTIALGAGYGLSVGRSSEVPAVVEYFENGCKGLLTASPESTCERRYILTIREDDGERRDLYIVKMTRPNPLDPTVRQVRYIPFLFTLSADGSIEAVD